jgi:endoribonuclease L-PSP, putative
MFNKAIHSDKAPKAIGPYSPAIKLGDFVYLSGQVPLDASTGELVSGGIEEQTHQVFKNIQAILEEMGLETRHIVKTTVFMTDLAEFSVMNEIYSTYFAEPYPARSTVQVGALPKGAKVEIECLVIDTLAYEQQMGSGCSCNESCEDCENCEEHE